MQIKNCVLKGMVGFIGGTFMLGAATAFAAELVLFGTYMLNTMILKQPNGIFELALPGDTSLIASGYLAGARGTDYNATAGLSAGLRFYDRRKNTKEVIVEIIDGAKHRSSPVFS